MTPFCTICTIADAPQWNFLLCILGNPCNQKFLPLSMYLESSRFKSMQLTYLDESQELSSVSFIEHIHCARHHVGHWLHISSFHSGKYMTRGGYRRSERLRDLSSVTQPGRGRATIWTKVLLAPKHVFVTSKSNWVNINLFKLGKFLRYYLISNTEIRKWWFTHRNLSIITDDLSLEPHSGCFFVFAFCLLGLFRGGCCCFLFKLNDVQTFENREISLSNAKLTLSWDKKGHIGPLLLLHLSPDCPVKLGVCSLVNQGPTPPPTSHVCSLGRSPVVGNTWFTPIYRGENCHSEQGQESHSKNKWAFW